MNVYRERVCWWEPDRGAFAHICQMEVLLEARGSFFWVELPESMGVEPGWRMTRQNWIYTVTEVRSCGYERVGVILARWTPDNSTSVL